MANQVIDAKATVTTAPREAVSEDQDVSAALREADAANPQVVLGLESAYNVASGTATIVAAAVQAPADDGQDDDLEGEGSKDSLQTGPDQKDDEDTAAQPASEQHVEESTEAASTEDAAAAAAAAVVVENRTEQEVKQIIEDKKKRVKEEQEEDKRDDALERKVREAEAQERVEESPGEGARRHRELPRPSPLEDKQLPPKQIEKLQKDILRQTDSKGLAEMLGSLEMDVYRLKDQIDKVNRQVKDGVRLKGQDPKESMVYPLSTCMQCILMLAAQYFVVYTAMALCKLFTEAFDLGPTRCEASLRAACESVFYAPMICVLFLGAQLRAQQIAGGHGTPSVSSEIAMKVCAWSVLVQTALVLAVPLLTGGAEVAVLDEEGSASMPELEGHAVAGLLSLVRYVALVSLLLGMSVISAEIVIMDARSLGVDPPDLWDDPMTARTEYAPPLHPATECAIALLILFFVVYILRAVLRTLLELSVQADEEGRGARTVLATCEKCLQTCNGAMNLAPMLCILFMALRMRALQLDPKLGQIPSWLVQCLHGCVLAQAVHMAIIICAWTCGIQTSVGSATSVIDEARHARVSSGISRTDLSQLTGGERFVIPARTPVGQKIVLITRGLALFATYVCASAVAVGIFALAAPAGRPTPRLPPAVRCAVGFAVMYLAVYSCLFVAQAIAVMWLSFRFLSPPRHGPLLQAVRSLRMAECSAKLCPMLAVLFLGARLRALQLRELQGSPQCWAQEAMYVGLMSMAVQLLAVLGATWLAPNVEVDENCGSPSAVKVTYVPGRVLLETIKICTFLALYGSVLAVGMSIVSNRPETAQCSKLGSYLPFLAGLEG